MLPKLNKCLDYRLHVRWNAKSATRPHASGLIQPPFYDNLQRRFQEILHSSTPFGC